MSLPCIHDLAESGFMARAGERIQFQSLFEFQPLYKAQLASFIPDDESAQTRFPLRDYRPESIHLPVQFAFWLQ
jgi:hypothetical protein